jgi:hypothetical protein
VQKQEGSSSSHIDNELESREKIKISGNNSNNNKNSNHNQSNNSNQTNNMQAKQ